MTRSKANWKRLEFRFIYGYDERVPAVGNQLDFTSADYTVWLVRRGAVTLVAGGDETTVEVGHWVLLPPGYTRTQRFETGSEILSFHFVLNWPGGRALYLFKSPIVETNELWRDLEERMLDVLAVDDVSSLSAFAERQSRLYAFLEEWHAVMASAGIEMQALKALDLRVEQALQELAPPRYFGALPYERLCERSGLSRVQLDRVFVQEIGKTPRQYVQERCLNWVTEQLLATARPIKAICYDAGFATTAHFASWFRQQTGVSPREYRRQRA